MDQDPKYRIRAVLEAQGHTYRSVGEKIGISPQAVSEIVNGRTEGATARYALATALGREVDDFWPNEAASKRSARRDRRRRRSGATGAEGTTADRGAARNLVSRRRRALREKVSVSICCPFSGSPAPVVLGVAREKDTPEFTILRCWDVAGVSLDCAMECLEADEWP